MCGIFFQALTAAERKKIYFEKLKATGHYEDYKKKKAADERDRQLRIKNGLAQLPKAVREKTKRLTRENNRKKAAVCRRRKREKMGLTDRNANDSQPCKPTNSTTTNHDDIKPYKTTSAVSKAVIKVKNALPSMSDKKKIVVKKLLRSFDAKDRQEIIADVAYKPKSSKSSKKLKSDVIAMVNAFYERDDISRISPNMRDCRQFKNPLTGVKETKQIRYLMYKLCDVHRLFVQHTEKGKICVCRCCFKLRYRFFLN